jgi:membrane AbrB-like protein
MSGPQGLRRLAGPALARLPPAAALSSLLLAIAAGFVAQHLHVPLAWIVGPMLATAIGGMSGLPVFSPPLWRRLGQLVIGTSIGLNLTEDVLLVAVSWLPVMILTSAIAICLAAAVSVPFGKLSGLDRQTAFFSMMPGGLSEMANIGAASGAETEPIAVTQALRVALVVCILPSLILNLDIHGDALANAAPQTQLPLASIALALALGLVGVAVLRSVRLNNPWMIGAIFGVGAGAVYGLLPGQIPSIIYCAGQFLIGVAVGARFRRSILLRLPRLFATGSLFVVILSALLFGYAVVLSRATGIDLATAALGSSPGGFAEMAVTAQTLHLSVGLVTAFHIVRAFFVNGLTSHFWNGLHRVGMFTFLERVCGHIGRPR